MQKLCLRVCVVGRGSGQKGKGLLWKKHNERKKNKMENVGYFKAKEFKKN